ncbi:hypothetical protein Tco_0217237 [Tanacetum coccineum]
MRMKPTNLPRYLWDTARPWSQIKDLRDGADDDQKNLDWILNRGSKREGQGKRTMSVSSAQEKRHPRQAGKILQVPKETHKLSASKSAPVDGQQRESARDGIKMDELLLSQRRFSQTSDPRTLKTLLLPSPAGKQLTISSLKNLFTLGFGRIFKMVVEVPNLADSHDP